MRYTVRKSSMNKCYWVVFDRLENKICRGYSHVSSAQSLCKYMNRQEKKKVVSA